MVRDARDRRIRIRANYAADAGYLSRLIQAVEADERRVPEWRQKVIGKLQETITLFMEAQRVNESTKPV